MKIQTSKISILAGIAALALSSTSCIKEKNGMDFAVQDYTFNDSINEGPSNAVCTIKVQWPVEGPEALVDSTRLWIAKAILVPDSVPLADGQRIVDEAGKATLAEAASDLQGYEADDPTFGFQYQYLWDVSMVYRSERVVSYAENLYEYLGGAHGSSVLIGATFDAKNGRKLGYDIINRADSAAICRLVYHGLLNQYFRAPEADISSALFVSESDLPLPQLPPYVVAGGLRFVYQQYEIGPYSSGMPSCTIPLTDIEEYLSPEAAKLLE